MPMSGRDTRLCCSVLLEDAGCAVFGVSAMMFQAAQRIKAIINMKRYFFFIEPPDIIILYHIDREECQFIACSGPFICNFMSGKIH